ncbi:ABC transporter ATP-binding protein [Gloeothece verrucosa]|uniref:ABC transporter related protein n=1 Tax=Gloeothece verrucosa (strain PCC 7822) TaxID=497965 RepID=E0UKY0_GLOV7|nr:ABC transporter ATP-binding protein [Gloeothece verrucosa]ADN17610.1 ABC transporter related protein [Gloeothece verrucosa PCC 7822]
MSQSIEQTTANLEINNVQNNHNQQNLITEFVKNIKNYSIVLARSLPLLWETAPKETSIIIILVLLRSCIPAISIAINKQIVDGISLALKSPESANFRTIISLVVFWVTAIFIENISTPWYNSAFINLADKLTANINIKLMEKADTFIDITNFENSKFYDELELLQNRASAEPLSLLQGILEILAILITLVSMLILLSTTAWWIPALILVACLPQTYLSFKLESEIWNKIFYKSPQSRRMRYYSNVLLTDTFVKEVRLFDLSAFFRQRYVAAFEDKYQMISQLRGKQAFITTILGILSASGNAFSFCWVVLQALAGKLTAGSILLLIQSLAYIQENINRLLQSSLILQRSTLFMEMFFRFMETQPSMTVSLPSKNVPKPLQSGIVFDNLEFAYPDGRKALSGISFTLHPGETVALVGENGAGKSTLVKLLARFYDPTSGNIYIDGENLKELDLKEWRKQIAVVFQDFCRYALTIGENIALGDTSAMDDLERLKLASEKSEIAYKIEKLSQGYSTPLGKQFDGTELSGGEWQKLAIARAFIREDDAQIMILDEPTAALDPRSEYEIFNSFAQLVRGKTAILVTHRLASVRLADRILVLKAGKLVEVGTHEELLQKNGEYATLWNMQAEQYQMSY